MKMPLAFCLQRPAVDAMSIRLANLSRAVGIKHGAMVSLLLDTVSRIDASDFFAEVARIRKASE
jgi:hypothetical protein